MSKEAMKLVPVEPTEEMLKAMDECSTEGYDERLYAGHAASVYMAALDAAPAPPAEPTSADYAMGYAEGFNDACKPAQQEPVAIHQFRRPHCSDWYDGVPDHHDGHGPYEVRILYTTPPQRTWVSLTKEELSEVYNQADWDTVNGWEYERAIEAKLKEKNNV